MTIKELENRTGMTRANIRFYEGEGLLSPKRLDNGYRNYLEEDARTLEKIKLLRQLQMDVDTTRKVQQGALTLEQALFTQLTRLEGDRAMIERAAEVCRALERSGVEYAALEPQPWLHQMEAPLRPQITEPVPAAFPEKEDGGWDGEPRACYCPWQRYFAKTLDILLCDTLINVLWLVLLHDVSLWRFQRSGSAAQWVCGTAALALILALEPLWLHFWGWTPGKWLFGLKLRDEDGAKLSIAQAWERSWRVAWEGYGWNIPIWGLWRMWKGRVTGLDGQDCYWDCENGYQYTKAERRFQSAVVYVVVAAVCIGAHAAALRWADLPVNRGGLTVAEFCENYNQYYKRYFDDLNYEAEPRLDQQGRWQEQESNAVGSTSHGNMSFIADDGSTRTIENVVEGATVWDQPEFTLADGRVTVVSLRMTSRDSIVWPDLSRADFALLALTGSLDGLNPFSFDWREWTVEAASQLVPAWEDAEIDYRGLLHVNWRVEYEGYEQMRHELVCVDESVPCRVEKTATISLIK